MHRPEMWSEIERVFHEAVKLSREDRAKFLDKACAGNEQLRLELESLLEQTHEQGPLDAARPIVNQIWKQSWRLPSGMRLGPYEIVSTVGVGGMGEVYRATDSRLSRTVAIKVLPPHLALRQDFR